MTTNPTPVPTVAQADLPLPDAVKSFLQQIQLSVTLPGEGIIIAIVNAWIVGRESMNQANRDQWDALMLKPATRLAAAMDHLADLLNIPK